MELLAYLNLFRRGLGQGIDAGTQGVDSALTLALLIAKLLQTLIGRTRFTGRPHMSFLERLTLAGQRLQLIRRLIGFRLGSLGALLGRSQGLLLARQLLFGRSNLACRLFFRGDEADDALAPIRNGTQLRHVLALSGLECLTALCYLFADSLQTFRSLLRCGEKLCMFFVRAGSTRL